MSDAISRLNALKEAEHQQALKRLQEEGEAAAVAHSEKLAQIRMHGQLSRESVRADLLRAKKVTQKQQDSMLAQERRIVEHNAAMAAIKREQAGLSSAQRVQWLESRYAVDHWNRKKKEEHKKTMASLNEQSRSAGEHDRKIKHAERLAREEELSAARLKQKLASQEALLLQKQSIKDKHRAERDAKKKAAHVPNAAEAFGGFAFGLRYGILEGLAGAGPIGQAVGWAGLGAEASLQVMTSILKVMGGIGVASAVVTANIASWYEDSISFNQQANGVIEALVGGDKPLAKQVGNYLRRDVARQTPFSTRETLMIMPKFASMGKSFDEADTITQWVSDTAFGLNPHDSTRAAHLAEKVVADVVSKGKLQAEEMRQFANLGIPMSMMREKIFDQWNSPEYQKANPKAGLLKSPAEVIKLISAGSIGPNMAINAAMTVSTERLGRQQVGDYSVWATNNTIGGLMSQLDSLPIEIADVIAQEGTSPGRVMDLLRGITATTGSIRNEGKIAFTLDQMVTDFLGTGTGFVSQFKGMDFLTQIRDGIGAFNWDGLGRNLADGLNWAGMAFNGTMQALELARPKFTAIFKGLGETFSTPEKVRMVATAFADLAVSLTALGVQAVKVLSYVGIGANVEATGAGVLAGEDRNLPLSLGQSAAFTQDAAYNTAAWAANGLASGLMKFRSIGAATGELFDAGFRGYMQIRSPSKLMQTRMEQVLAGAERALPQWDSLGRDTGLAMDSGVQNTLSNGGASAAPATVINLEPHFHQAPGQSVDNFAQAVLAALVPELQRVC